jgi:uncharacterized protein (TIGR03437 family)
VLLNLSVQLQQHAIDLIHMDGNPTAAGLCYAPNHSHLPGGGNWWFQNYAQIYRDIRTKGRAANQDFAMGGEFYAEPYLNLTDSGQDETNTGLDPSAIGSGVVRDSSKVSYIPLWQAVYHDYTLTYSMLAFLDGHDLPYYRRGLALPLIWGEIPMIEADAGVPYQLTAFNSSLVRYLQRAVSLRTTYGFPFVVLGRMLRPPQPTVPAYYVPAAKQIPYTIADTSGFNAPSVLGSAWTSPQGDAALIFTNISDNAVSFSWTMTAADVPLASGKRYDLYVLRNGTCVSRQPRVSLPYTLALDASSTDIVMAVLAQEGADQAPRFPDCATSSTPAVTSVRTANGGPDIAQNTWIEIKGINLVPSNTPSTDVIWSDAPEFASGRMPTTLGGVSVTVNGKPAYVYFYCSGATSKACTADQINVLTPLDDTLGAAQVIVRNGSSTSAPFTANLKPVSPALLLAAGSYVLATHADYTLVGPSSLYPGFSSPAKPNETVSLYAVGFGLPATQLAASSATQSGPLPVFPVCMVGALQGSINFAGVIGPGLYQINLTIPSGAAGGDNLIACSYGGAQTPAGNLVTVAGGH